MSKSSIDRLREAEIAVTERKKQLSDELSASLSAAHADAEKEVELAQEKAEKFIAEERSKSEKAAEDYGDKDLDDILDIIEDKYAETQN